MEAVAAIPWGDMPDYARVALVLAAVIAAGALGTRLVRGRRKAALDGADSRRGRRQAQRQRQPKQPRLETAVNADTSPHEELPLREPDPVLRALHWIMRIATYVLAVAMVVVIIEGVVSVIYTLYQSMVRPPYLMVPNIVQTFGAFLAVLIAYEIFANITLYIRTDVFPVKLVVATALMAIARKIIIMDMDEYSALDLVGIGAIVIGLGVSYWLVALADTCGGPARSRWSFGARDKP
jgi:uncharacterized membrane protein (DUF373 family)